jgi:hypothetical protein
MYGKQRVEWKEACHTLSIGTLSGNHCCAIHSILLAAPLRVAVLAEEVLQVVLRDFERGEESADDVAEAGGREVDFGVTVCDRRGGGGQPDRLRPNSLAQFTRVIDRPGAIHGDL